MTQVPDASPSQPFTKRARRLLIIFSIAMTLWIGAMLLMYFLTVYPQRHNHPSTAIDSAQSVR